MPLAPSHQDSTAAWLRLALTSGLGPRTARELLSAVGLPEQILACGRSRLSTLIGAQAAAALLDAEAARDGAIESALSWAAAAPAHHLLTLEDPRYPQRLLAIADPPLVLYVLGDPAALSSPGLAVVGSRHATAGGKDTAHGLAGSLAERGLAIISGLARGIDAAAHEGALAGCGTTVAVIGTGIDQVYPRTHRDLAERIVAGGGALVGELPLGAPPLVHHFPRRNRLIAGLAVGTLVVEAARQSGSLITARLAAEAGREVMAIPGSIHSPLSKGCHRLIRDGARLVETVDDVLEELRAQFQPTSAPGALQPAQASTAPGDPSGAGALAGASPTLGSLLDAMGYDPVDADLLIDRTGLQAGEIGALLSTLELAGTVQRLLDGRFQRRADRPTPTHTRAEAAADLPDIPEGQLAPVGEAHL